MLTLDLSDIGTQPVVHYIFMVAAGVTLVPKGHKCVVLQGIKRRPCDGISQFRLSASTVGSSLRSILREFQFRLSATFVEGRVGGKKT